MMNITNIYCNDVSTDPEYASNLQKDIAYIFTNFHRDTDTMAITLERVRSVFYDAMGLLFDKNMRDMFGIMTTSHAFDIPAAQGMSPSSDDARIAFIIGKPVAVERKGVWSMCVEKRYVVALQVRDKSSVHISKVYPTSHKIVRNAIQCPIDVNTVEEGKRVTGHVSCCTKLYDNGKKITRVVQSKTKAQVDKMVDEACVMFDRLMDTIQNSIGIAPVSHRHITELKRLHSLPIQRCDTIVIEKVVAGMKRTVGETTLPVSKVQK
jgi:hypothetical protein